MIPKRNIGRIFGKALSQPRYAVHAFRRRLFSYLSYLRKTGKSAPPETISLFLTYWCNLHCEMCGQWGKRGASLGYSRDVLRTSLEVEMCLKLIDEVSVFSPTITLFGGEPLLYKGWERIAGYATKRGLRCNLITNGTLLLRNDNVSKLIESGVKEVIFSLDGPDTVHDEIRGRKGIFRSAYKGLAYLREMKDSGSLKFPVLNINSAIFEKNYMHFPDMIKIAERLGAATITFHHLIFTNDAIYKAHNYIFEGLYGIRSLDWGGFVRDDLPNIDTSLLLQGMEEALNTKNKVMVSFYPNYTAQEVRKYYSGFGFVPVSYRLRCLSPWMVAYIFPDGTVRPCLSLSLSLGNIKHQSFLDTWNSPEYVHFRKDIMEKGGYPVCTRCTEFYRF